MKIYFYLLPVLFLALLQGSILPLNLVLLLVLTQAVLKPGQQSFFLAFWSGLLLDLAQGTPLGFSSLIFLLAVLILFFYSKKFEVFHAPFLAVFVFLTSLIYNRLIIGYFNWQRSLILAFLIFLFIFFWQKFILKTFERKVRLRSLK